MENSPIVRHFSPHDAEMMALRQWAVSQIAAEYSVPGGRKVGLSARRRLEDETSYSWLTCWKPNCRNFCSMLNQRILVPDLRLLRRPVRVRPRRKIDGRLEAPGVDAAASGRPTSCSRTRPGR